MTPPSFKGTFVRLSTGTKMLLILTAALLPLGFIALLTSLDMAKSAQDQRRGAAQMTTALYAAGIDAAIKAGLAAVRIPLASSQSAPYLCTALARRPGEPDHAMSPIALFDTDGRRICQSHGTPITGRLPPARQNDQVWLDTQRGVLLITAARSDRSLFAETEIPLNEIPLNIANDRDLPIVSIAILQGSAAAQITGRPGAASSRLLYLSAPVSAGGLSVQAGYQANPLRSRTVLMILLPILMWMSAAFTGWFIVKRLLLVPLAQLQGAVDRFRAGLGVLAIPRLTTPAQEIQDLAASFANASERIVQHEKELEEGLARQTKLTREVHHRVKNNLQVVSSLINLHARGATDEAVADAYAAIQRRVDALAVVHRNHYAELEENRGLSLRTLVGELASNLRASAPSSAAGMPIALNMINANVSQDIAVPVAFLITEIVELMMHCHPSGGIVVSLVATDVPDRAKLTIETQGLADKALDNYPSLTRFDRVVTGLARQLRSPLEQDRVVGRFEILISIFP